MIEDVTAKTLSTLIGNVDNLVVLFCKCDSPWTSLIYISVYLREMIGEFQMIMESMIQ